MWYGYHEYKTCSRNTRDLAGILVNYINQNQNDMRLWNYYPLLDRIVDWFDTEYGA